MMDIQLSSDGKHTVHIWNATLEEVADLAPTVSALHESIVRRFGSIEQLCQQEAGIVKAHPKALPVEPERSDTPQAAEAAGVPHCPVHDRPMKLRRGVYGTFWSCSVRSPAGRRCSFTKEVDSDGDAKKATA